MLFITEGVAHEIVGSALGAGELAHGKPLDGGIRALQQGDEADSLKGFKNRKTSQFGQRGGHVEKLNRLHCLPSLVVHTWINDQERRPRRLFVIGVLAPHAVVPEVPSMVAPEDNDGVFQKTIFLEGLHQLVNLAVDVGDAGVVAVDHVPLHFIRKTPIGYGGITASQFPGVLEVIFRGAFRHLLVGCQLEGVGIIHVPVLLRGDKRQVRLLVTDGEEERFPGGPEFTEQIHRPVRAHAILVEVVRDILFQALGGREVLREGDDILAGSDACFLRPGFPLLEAPLDFRVPEITVSQVRGVHGRVGPAPGSGVVGLPAIAAAGIEDFTDGGGVVTGLLEVLWQGAQIRQGVAHARLEVPHLDRVGAEPGEGAGARGPADGLLAVAVEEDGAPCGQPVHRRGNGLRVAE